MLSYHAAAPLEDAVRLARQKIPSAAALKLHSFSFDDFGLSDDETLQVGRREGQRGANDSSRVVRRRIVKNVTCAKADKIGWIKGESPS